MTAAQRPQEGTMNIADFQALYDQRIAPAIIGDAWDQLRAVVDELPNDDRALVRARLAAVEPIMAAAMTYVAHVAYRRGAKHAFTLTAGDMPPEFQ